MLEAYNGDMEAMMRDMMRNQLESGHTVVSFNPKSHVGEDLPPYQAKSK